jgi:hypothetical protein
VNSYIGHGRFYKSPKVGIYESGKLEYSHPGFSNDLCPELLLFAQSLLPRFFSAA